MSFLLLRSSIDSLLFRWFHVFYDVHSARLKTGGSNRARSLLANNAATPSIGKRLRPIPSDRVLVQPPRIMQAQSVNTVGLTARQPLARRPSNAQSLANGRDPSTSTVDQRRNIVERGLSAQAGSHAGSQAPSLARRNSQHQFIQHQRENQARQQALLERQKLQQIQMDQVELQNQMLSNSRQNSGSGTQTVLISKFSKRTDLLRLLFLFQAHLLRKAFLREFRGMHLID